MAATCLGMVFLIFLGFGRVFLGACAFNQVIFGAILGLVLAFVGHFRIKSFFLGIPEMLYSDDRGSNYAVTCGTHMKTLLVALIGPMILAFVVYLLHSERAFYNSNAWKYR